MRIDMLEGGRAALAAQAASPSNKITFTRFELADEWAALYPSNSVAPIGTVFATGGPSRMKYIALSASQASVVCRVYATDPQGFIGSMVIFVTHNGIEYPFVMVDDFGVLNYKLKAPDNRVGMEYNVNLALNIPNLLNRFDFSNLGVEVCEWLQVTDHRETPEPFTEEHDLMVVHDHPDAGGRTVVAFNVGNLWMGVCDTAEMDDTNGFEQQAGQVRDGYTYVKGT